MADDEMKIEGSDPESVMLAFERDGKHAYFDIRDGKWDFWGDLEVTEAAQALFESLGESLISEIRKRQTK